MTPNRTRAEQTCDGLCESGDCLRNGNHSQCETADEIEQALDEAVEEERVLRSDWGYRIECLEKQLAESNKAGTLAGLEMAAGIADECHSGWIAQTIRAIAKELEGTTNGQ